MNGAMSQTMDIQGYISKFDELRRVDLQAIYEALKQVLVEAQERISYGMPTFYQGRNIIHFAANKNHLGLYPGPEAIEAFQEELREFKSSKGATLFPWNQEMPISLIQRIGLWCYEHYQK